MQQLENLKKLKLVDKENRVTNATLLSFGKVNIGYNVYIGWLKTPSFTIDDRMFNNALFDVIEDVMHFWKTKWNQHDTIQDYSDHFLYQKKKPSRKEWLCNIL